MVCASARLRYCLRWTNSHFKTAKEIFGNGAVVGSALAGRALTDAVGLQALKREVPLKQILCDGMAVVGIGGPLMGQPHRGDSGQLHLPVYALAGATKLRFQQVVKAVSPMAGYFCVTRSYAANSS